MLLTRFRWRVAIPLSVAIASTFLLDIPLGRRLSADVWIFSCTGHPRGFAVVAVPQPGNALGDARQAWGCGAQFPGVDQQAVGQAGLPEPGEITNMVVE